MQYNPLETYFAEAEELLGEIEQLALLLDNGGEADTINQIFRAFHTIKGSGAMVGLDAVAGFTHHVESLLDRVRAGAVPVTPDLTRLVLESKDHIKNLLGAERGETPVADASTSQLIASLGAISEVCQTPHVPQNVETASAGAWRILFHPHSGILSTGADPLLVLRDLAKLGQFTVTAHLEDLPTLDKLEPEASYLWWTTELRGASDLNQVRDVFIFVEDDCKLEIEPVALNSAPEEPRPAAVRTASQPTASRESTVRVPAARLDRLVNLVGELVMNQARLARAASRSCGGELADPVQELERLVDELRDNVLGIRMLPIGSLFGRFRRLVHDLAAELGKEAELVTEGADTELDKSILDQLSEPLVHCLRNCLDHAVEPPGERLSSGKPRRARIGLSAVHAGADVVVTIEDDGRGIDKAAVLAKAVEKQLISPDARLEDSEIFKLILVPGFSTARKVTSVSGRGVGMDAVKRQVDAMRGALSLASEPGRGTRVSIRLPLTLAIIDGLLVEIGGDQFIIPMASVTETVELLRSQRARNNGRNVLSVRGELVPYIDLRAAFRMESTAPFIEKVVLVNYEGQRVGLVVDRVLGTHQTVIQTLGQFFKNINVVSGATIMGDGRVALIMDVPAVVRYADSEVADRAGNPRTNTHVACLKHEHAMLQA